MRGTAPIHVAIYLDEGYAIPATVLVLSMLRHLRAGIPLHLHVLGVGLAEETKRTMATSWPADRLTIRWIDVDFSADAAGCVATGYLSRAAYARLLIDRYLPAEIEKVLTVDTDGLILDDISSLWSQSPRHACLMAVRDSFVRTLAEDPSDFIERDGANASAPYFNSGLMLIDTRRWRAQDVSARCLALAARHPGRAVIGDNTLLNAVIVGAWEPLPLRWNCSSRHLAMHSYPSLRNQVHPHQQVLEATRSPAFLHFVSKHKPWQEGHYHPDRGLYVSYLFQTAWAERVAKPEPSRPTWESVFFPWRCCRRARDVARQWNVPRRSAADALHLMSRMCRLGAGSRTAVKWPAAARDGLRIDPA